MKAVVIAAVCGIAFLRLFYRSVQTKWPEAYFGGDYAGYSVTTNPYRYIAFRFLPIYVVTLFVAVTIDRVGGNIMLAVTAVVLGHAALTTLQGIANAFATRRLAAVQVPLLVMQVVATLGFVLAGFAAVITRSVLAPVIPEPSELSASLWTALLAAIAGISLVRLSQAHPTSGQVMLEASRKSISDPLWLYAASRSTTAGVDPRLTQAIMLAENINRPPWFRRLEYVKGRVLKRGTYGVMQVASDVPVSDRESIDMAIMSKLSGHQTVVAGGYPESGALRAVAMTYNADPNFAQLVIEAYQMLHYQQSGN